VRDYEALVRNEQRMYQAGLLKIAFKLRLDAQKGLNELVEDTAGELGFEPEDFRSYIYTNMFSLMATVRPEVCWVN